MSDFTVEIIEENNILEIETSVMEVTNNIEIETSTLQSLEIVDGYAGTVVYASDIIGLDSYLANFIDAYEIDCGSP